MGLEDLANRHTSNLSTDDNTSCVPTPQRIVIYAAAHRYSTSTLLVVSQLASPDYLMEIEAIAVVEYLSRIKAGGLLWVPEDLLWCLSRSSNLCMTSSGKVSCSTAAAVWSIWSSSENPTSTAERPGQQCYDTCVASGRPLRNGWSGDRRTHKGGLKMADTDKRTLLDWDALEVGETFDKYEYVLTQEMIDTYRKGVMDGEAGFPTIAHKVDVKQYNARYTDNGSVNARCAFQCYNPPVAGKKLTVTAWIADKYLRRGKNYIVTEAVSVDEDGRLIDRVITHELKQPAEVGKKWEG